jgi:hypothetical protein
MAARLVIGQRPTRLIRGPMIHPFSSRGRISQQLYVKIMGQPKLPKVNSRPKVGKSVAPDRIPSITSDCCRKLNQLSRGFQEKKVLRSQDMNDVVRAVGEHASHFRYRIQHCCGRNDDE